MVPSDHSIPSRIQDRKDGPPRQLNSREVPWAELSMMVRKKWAACETTAAPTIQVNARRGTKKKAFMSLRPDGGQTIGQDNRMNRIQSARQYAGPCFWNSVDPVHPVQFL